MQRTRKKRPRKSQRGETSSNIDSETSTTIDSEVEEHLYINKLPENERPRKKLKRSAKDSPPSYEFEHQLSSYEGDVENELTSAFNTGSEATNGDSDVASDFFSDSNDSTDSDCLL